MKIPQLWFEVHDMMLEAHSCGWSMRWTRVYPGFVVSDERCTHWMESSEACFEYANRYEREQDAKEEK